MVSIYKDDEKFKNRTFDFGKEFDVIINEEIKDCDEKYTGSIIQLLNIRKGSYEKDIDIFAHRILEQILNYFADDEYKCPIITIHDESDAKQIVLNNLIGTNSNSLIQIKNSDAIDISGKIFKYRSFKILHPRNQKSRIFLTARNQVVTSTALEQYIPEFATDFSETYKEGGKYKERNYIVRYYVQGEYLDSNVTAERDSFNFGKEPDSIYPVSSCDIESKIAKIAKEDYGDIVTVRYEKKKSKIEEYANENIWYKAYTQDVDFDKVKVNQTDSDIEDTLHRVKYQKDLEIKRKISSLTSDQRAYPDAIIATDKLIQEVKKASTSELAHYVAFRKSVLELFKTTIELTNDGKYQDEKAVHDLIFPTESDTRDTSYEGHNLWIIDEGLNFTQYLSSDKNIFKGKNRDRPDIAAFHYQVSYREVNQPYSPISIFEFKKPGRHDFVDKSSKENPFEQIKRYVQAIKSGEVKTIEGLEIQVSDSTPFYGYIVADANKKIRDWLEMENFTSLPDGQGWFYQHSNMNLYIEYITWQKLIKDAEIRHRKFFEMLGIV